MGPRELLCTCAHEKMESTTAQWAKQTDEVLTVLHAGLGQRSWQAVRLQIFAQCLCAQADWVVSAATVRGPNLDTRKAVPYTLDSSFDEIHKFVLHILFRFAKKRTIFDVRSTTCVHPHCLAIKRRHDPEDGIQLFTSSHVVWVRRVNRMQ